MTTKLNKILLSKYNNYFSINPNDFDTETDLLNKVAELLNSGIDILELNTKNTNSANLIRIAEKIRELTAVFNALFIIYDRIDIAKIVEADGISLDDTTLSIKSAKKLTEDSMLLGAYCTREEEIAEIKKQNADFVITYQNTTSEQIKIFILNKSL